LNAALAKAAWQAQLELGFALDGTRSVLRRNRHFGPLTVQKALYPEGRGICHALIVHPPAGIAEGDRLAIDIRVEALAHAVVSTPSATRWYKSAAAYASQDISLVVSAGATLEWLPQENLFFENARANQRLVIHAEEGARVLAWDAYTLGRSARGEAWQGGSVRLASELHRQGAMIFTERGAIAGGDSLLEAAPGLFGMRSGATFLALAKGCTSALAEELARELPYGPDLAAGVSAPVDGLLLVRILGRDSQHVRGLLHSTWARLRPLLLGVGFAPLRIWAC